MYEHIVVPSNGTADSQRAMTMGSDLARVFDAELVVVTASPVDDDGSLNVLKATAMAKSDATRTVWIEPEPSMPTALSTVTSFRPKSLICMVSGGGGGVKQAMAGSPVERVLRQTDAPIVVVGPEWNGAVVSSVRHLVICVDGSATAEAAIPLAATWARQLGLDTTVVHVHTDPGASPVDLDRLARTVAWSSDTSHTVTVDSSSAVDGVLDLVEATPAPLVVVATKSLTGLDRLLHRSFTADLARRCAVPLLVRRGPLPVVTPSWIEPSGS